MNVSSAELAALAVVFAAVTGFLAGRTWGKPGYLLKLATAATFVLSLFFFCSAALTE
jgi:hypothetical protein